MCTSAHGCVHMCKTGICIHVDINAGVYTPENTGTCAQQAHMYMGMHMWYRDVRTYRCAHIHRNTCSYTCLLGTHAQDIHKHTYTQEQMYMVTLFGHVNPQEHLCTHAHTHRALPCDRRLYSRWQGVSAYVLCLYPDLPSGCRSSDQMLPQGSLSGCRTPLCSQLLPHALAYGWLERASPRSIPECSEDSAQSLPTTCLLQH